jgi:glycosyltransferase involved in cell wall biosynthesis
VLFESRKGYGYACLAGIEHAINYGAEIIVFLDGDFSDYPEELPMLVRPIIEQGYNIVIGEDSLHHFQISSCGGLNGYPSDHSLWSYS